MPKTFTKFQKEEILALIQIRIETIDDDPMSADEFESSPNGLTNLITKVQSGVMYFTDAEQLFLIQECQQRKQFAIAHVSNGQGARALGLVNSMENAIQKIKQSL